MHPNELIGMNYLSSTPDMQFPYQLALPNINLLQQNNIQQITTMNNQILSGSSSFTSFPNTQISSPVYMSSNSTSDDSEEIQQLKIIDERKQRRMISNRESARRSRMRKQKHLDELWSQVMRLRNENNNLIDKLNYVSENHEKVLQENAKLKEETSDLRQKISNMQMQSASPYNDGFRELDDLPCTTAHLRAESSSQYISSSSD